MYNSFVNFFCVARILIRKMGFIHKNGEMVGPYYFNNKRLWCNNIIPAVRLQQQSNARMAIINGEFGVRWDGFSPNRQTNKCGNHSKRHINCLAEECLIIFIAECWADARACPTHSGNPAVFIFMQWSAWFSRPRVAEARSKTRRNAHQLKSNINR